MTNSNMPPDLAAVVQEKFREMLARASKRKTVITVDNILVPESPELRKAVLDMLGEVAAESHIMTAADLCAEMARCIRDYFDTDVQRAHNLGQTLLIVLRSAQAKFDETEGDGPAKWAAYNELFDKWMDEHQDIRFLMGCATAYCVGKYVEANSDLDTTDQPTEGATDGREPTDD